MNKDYRIGLLIKEHGTASNAIKYLLDSEAISLGDNDSFLDYLVDLEEKHSDFFKGQSQILCKRQSSIKNKRKLEWAAADISAAVLCAV